MSQTSTLSVKPIIHYPRVAQVGETYLMTIDLLTEQKSTWQTEGEEYPIYCVAESDIFNIRSIGDPVILLNRFGGCYGKITFSLTAPKEELKGEIRLKMTNAYGVTFKFITLQSQSIQKTVYSQEVRHLSLPRRRDKEIRTGINKDYNIDNILITNKKAPRKTSYQKHAKSLDYEVPIQFRQESDYDTVYQFIYSEVSKPVDKPASELVYDLLVNGNISETNVRSALERIVAQDDFDGPEGLRFINRCIYTAINFLHLDEMRHDDLKRLVERLAKAPSSSQNPNTRKLRRTLHHYIQHDMYQCVRRQTRLIEPFNQVDETILGDLFPHYSFLYINGTVTSDIKRLDSERKQVQKPSLRLTEGIHSHRKKRIYQLRQELSTYWEHRWQKSAQLAPNPTRLSNEELDMGIKLYNTRRPDSFRERASEFSRRYRPDASMRQCREDILAYMIQPLNMLTPQHRRLLIERFTHSLKSMETGSGVMNATVIQAFKKILDELFFFASKPTSKNVYHNLEKYVREISPCKYAAILLYLVLGCPMIIYKLDERLTQLYFFYEEESIGSKLWLFEFFEFMHLALVMNYLYYDKGSRLSVPPDIYYLPNASS